MSDKIRFYSANEAYGEFSNFALYPVKVRGRMWPTSEHFFQSMKFKDENDLEQVRKAKSPMEAARIGRNRKRKLRRDWEGIKISVMKEAVLANFTQHDHLAELLISTGDAELIEHTPRDSYWGDGGNGRGKNMLGKILMEVIKSHPIPTNKPN